MKEFRIINVALGSSDTDARVDSQPGADKLLVTPDDAEQMGSKEKFWCKDTTGLRYLLKFARPQTGEDWAEKVAAELAEVCGLPHATVELASFESRRAVLVSYFLRRGDRLVPGNELLLEEDPSYPATRTYKVPQHTLEAVLNVLKDVSAPPHKESGGLVDSQSAIEVFSGYLVLDALIGNTDRHHENWGIVREAGEPLKLAPTYDHGSSLGRELSDEARERRLEGSDKRADLQAYADKARSAFYLRPSDQQPLSTFDAVVQAGRDCHPAVSAWIQRVGEVVRQGQHIPVVESIPASLMSQTSKNFALKLLKYNAEKLSRLSFQ